MGNKSDFKKIWKNKGKKSDEVYHGITSYSILVHNSRNESKEQGANQMAADREPKGKNNEKREII